jgi:hypothetical protein
MLDQSPIEKGRDIAGPAAKNLGATPEEASSILNLFQQTTYAEQPIVKLLALELKMGSAGCSNPERPNQVFAHTGPRAVRRLESPR